MKYILITNTGKVFTFYLKAVAETYQQAYGGTIINEQTNTQTKQKVIG